MKKCMYIILALCAVAAASNTRGARDLEAQKKALPEERDRMLFGSSCPIHAFTVETTIRGDGEDYAECSTSELVHIGLMIDVQLQEIGYVVEQLVNMVFHTHVCPQPDETVSSTLGTGPVRKLQGGFIWYGGAVCQSCGDDNGDARRNLWSGTSESYEEQARNLVSEDSGELFIDEFDSMFDGVREDMEDDLVAKITTQLVVDYPCMGSDPRVEVAIAVAIVESPQQISNIRCAGNYILAEVEEGAV